MSDGSKIEWTKATWSPTTGCDRTSPGCDHCYALTLAKRLKGMGSQKYQRDGNSRTSGPGFGITVHPDVLDLPLHWQKPRRVFVDSMSDLFHEVVPDEYIARVFAVMARAQQHTFQILTKRHGRMRSLLSSAVFRRHMYDALVSLDYAWINANRLPWPLPNVWLGVSTEDQKWADIRIPALLDTPATVRFVSAEPLLGMIDLDRYLWLIGGSTAGPFYDHAGRRRGGGGIGGQAIISVPAGNLHWVIAGGESGPGARPMHPSWARQLRDQCVAAEVPFFFKQWGQWRPGGDPERPASWFDESGQEVPAGAGATAMVKIGKKAAGRVLDGWTWDQFPVAAEAVSRDV